MIGLKVQSNFDAKKLGKQVQRILDEVKTKTHQTARSLTPVDTGYAKSQWDKKSTPKGFEVKNEVPYIQFLDKGHSRQAPRGITKPTVRKMTGFIKSRRLSR
tara:strand:- start:368 stop:673 length:306 start_codon:yes stop_codon:yes gene_type:complete